LWWWRLEVWHLMGELEAIREVMPVLGEEAKLHARHDRHVMRAELRQARKRVEELSYK